MKLNEIEDYLKKFLLTEGMEEEDVQNMDITIGELGLTSIERMKIAVALKKKFGYMPKIANNDEITLVQICQQVFEHAQ